MTRAGVAPSMQNNHNAISHIHNALPATQKILISPRRSYSQLQQALALAESITERTLCELLALRQSQQQGADTDSANKLQLHQQMQSVIKHAQRHSSGFACLSVQLDSFKRIQHSFGAEVAKQLSDQTLAYLHAAVRDCDVVSQQADGQFLLLITDVSRVYDAVLVAEKLMQKLTLLNGLCQAPVDICCSIGISRFPEDGNDAMLLIERATAAMLNAQNRGGNQFSLLRS